MRTYYHTCERCGANLDPGERCECEKENEPRVAATTSRARSKISYMKHITNSNFRQG